MDAITSSRIPNMAIISECSTGVCLVEILSSGDALFVAGWLRHRRRRSPITLDKMSVREVVVINE